MMYGPFSLLTLSYGPFFLFTLLSSKLVTNAKRENLKDLPHIQHPHEAIIYAYIIIVNMFYEILLRIDHFPESAF